MIRIRQVKVPIQEDREEIWLKKIGQRIRCNNNEIIRYVISKKSLDARDKDNIMYVYEFDVELDLIKEKKILNNNKDKDIIKTPDLNYYIPDVKIKNKKIIIVGSGPAGLMCAYMLAGVGYKPLIIEQGAMMDERITTVNSFFDTNKLNPLTNIQFGEGGAGTFSDGKLNTLVKDKNNRGRKVFEIFVENGAPEEIMYLNNPHIGTDILRKVVVSLRKKIIALGGEFRFNTKLTGLIINNQKITGIYVNEKDRIDCDNLVLAIGHSARDTFYLLREMGIEMANKNFAVGLRVIHNQELINKSQYGEYSKYLKPANYKLTHTCSNGRGVYSFCMCPGGYVVNASSEDKRVVVNGMSNYKRDSGFSNSAIVVTVNKDDYGDSLFGGVEFQRKLEEKAYLLGNGSIPVQSVKDYLDNSGDLIRRDLSNCVLGKYEYSNLNKLFSLSISESLKEGIRAFDKKINGFISSDAFLLGVESRTSSPIRIIRNESLESNIKGIYPCGEGAGYAGGITTAAIDGIKVFEEIIKE